ncbi:hypothetical protein DFH06DRAFT_1255078 [Mycena polygramma]|nr:hypothetical protein DFH06DRAFT_1255078 [Mycena polygramma]
MTDIDSTSPHPRIPPFRGRQRTSDSPLPRFNPRAAKFYAMRSRLPPLTSPAACARYRLGRENATRIAAAARLDIQLNRIVTLLDTLLALPHTLAAVIHTPDCASSPSCDPVPSAHFRPLPPRTPSPRTPLNPFPHSLTPPPLSYAPPSTSPSFSVDDCITRSPDTIQSRDADGERFKSRRNKWRENHIDTPYDPPW